MRRCWRTPDVGDHLDEGLRAAVEDGDLEVVEFHDGVVDAHADEGRQQVLGGRDEHALFHQAGGVADLGDIAADGLDLEAVEVGAAEDDAGSRPEPGGCEAERELRYEDRRRCIRRIADCTFVDQNRQTNSSACNRLQGDSALGLLYFSHNPVERARPNRDELRENRAKVLAA